MSHQIESDVFACALVAALDLKHKLEERLNGRGAHGQSCVVGVDFPVDYRNQIARFECWSCDMVDSSGKRWSQGLTAYISRAELYPMFRKQFAGIDVRLTHPLAQVFDDKALGGRSFQGNGRAVTVKADGGPVYLRPIANLADAVWVNAELRLDKDVPGYEPGVALLACNLDALEFGIKSGREVGPKFGLAEPDDLATFYCRIFGNCPSTGSDLFLPIARFRNLDVRSGDAIFELDQSVEVFVPPCF